MWSPVLRGTSHNRRSLFAVPALLLCALALSPAAHASGGTVLGYGNNQFGQVGNGTFSETGCKCVQTPTLVAGLTGVTQVAAAENHTLALLADGSVRAWGYDVFGQLGDGGLTNQPSPVPVAGLGGAIAVAAGWSHSLALLGNGTVVAWGLNNRGQLGRGTTSGPEDCKGAPCSKVPLPVPGLEQRRRDRRRPGLQPGAARRRHGDGLGNRLRRPARGRRRRPGRLRVRRPSGSGAGRLRSYGDLGRRLLGRGAAPGRDGHGLGAQHLRRARQRHRIEHTPLLLRRPGRRVGPHLGEGDRRRRLPARGGPA